MFLDASAIIAIVSREPGWEEILKRLESPGVSIRVSPLARFEAVLGLARKRDGGRKSRAALEIARAAIDEFCRSVHAEEISVSPEIRELALDASMTYGKAVGHPADLNFGDCFSYACAKVLGVPLIYKGADFARTDLA
jgi:ribonuclease VapC